MAFLRFGTLFTLLLLLINPVVKTKSLEIVKTPLPVVIDNSSSIAGFVPKETVEELVEKIKINSKIQEKYNVQYFQFDTELKSLDTLNFKGNQTHIDNVAKSLQQFNRNQDYPVVLLTDGNQTVGNDYVYSFKENTPVFPIVLGDTTTVLDFKINKVNANKYAFLKNKFPVELFVQYNGKQTSTATLSIQEGKQTVSKQNITFSKDKKAQSLLIVLDANTVGLKKYTAILSTSINEKNTKNNAKQFAIEVMDQRSEIAIISDITHPDISAIKRSIETNKQRKVSIFKPSEVKSLDAFNVIIFYQPNSGFKSLIENAKKAQKNSFIITGLSTDFNALNQLQNDFSFKMSAQKEDYLADFNSNFTTFSIQNIGFESFPPLENKFGTITALKNNTPLLNARIRNVALESPLLTFLEEGKCRTAYLFGENLWKWRMETYLNKKSFEDFDIFMDKTVQYLASNSDKKNLMVTAERFYNSGQPIVISAQYFNKNYEFDTQAELSIIVTNSDTKASKTYNFLIKGNEFQVNFDGLEKGNYSYLVTESKSKAKVAGNFEVLDFEMEQQFVNPDKERLEQLAAITDGAVYYPNQVNDLVNKLLDDKKYIPIQKEIVEKSPLIDWKWLIGIVIFFLSLEWFTRKYNGLV
ncbi:hypothetical protein ACFS5J_01425 [Flavobacterium chuncheonense]|uniref:VWA domain-containing protein n=1 Tax=Flavobacterium chuncheonense TaxID=2026653 RepID=A0ABW5YHZ2_9FLAO